MFWLIFNHVDAWSMSFVIAAVSLALRGSLHGGTLAIPALLAFGAWFAFALNDRFDAPYDAQKPEKARRNAFTSRPGRVFDVALVAAILPLGVAFAGFGPRGLAVLVVGVLAAWSYSAPPLRLKTRPGFDLFTHAAFVETFPYLAAIALAGAPLTPFDALAWVMLALASLSAQLEQQARDYDLDSRLERNFTTVVGLETNHRILCAASYALLFAGFAGALTGILPPFLWPGLALTVPMIIHRLVRPPGTARSETLIRWSIAAGAVYIAAVVAGAL